MTDRDMRTLEDLANKRYRTEAENKKYRRLVFQIEREQERSFLEDTFQLTI